jgi:hypothetical protein
MDREIIKIFIKNQRAQAIIDFTVMAGSVIVVTLVVFSFYGGWSQETLWDVEAGAAEAMNATMDTGALVRIMTGEEAGVILCHRPPGNPENTKTETVSQGEVAAHLGHGDSLGPCA